MGGMTFKGQQKVRGEIRGNLYASELPSAWKRNKGEIGTKAFSEKPREPVTRRQTEH